MFRMLGSGLARTEDFFGCSVHRVDQINLKIAFEHDYPDWLKGLPLARDLPRRQWNGSVELPHFFYTDRRTLREHADLIVWVVNHTTGRWSLSANVLWLETDEDAVLYRLSHD